MKSFYVYIMTNKRNGTLYTGVTSDLSQRIWEHRNKVGDGFTKKYDITQLVYYEVFENPEDAISREKALKRWKRSWKIKAIEKRNPEWRDLYDELIDL